MQRIIVRVKPQAKKNGVTQDGDLYIVQTTAPAHEGKANAAVIKLLAEYFDIAPSCVTLVRGATMKEKVFEIDD